MKRACRGGRHCGGLRSEVDLDFAAGTLKRNCACCAKSRFRLVRVEQDDLRALGEAADDRGLNPVAHHFFCPRCDVHVWDRVDAPNMAGRDHVNVSVACLGDVDIEELMAAPLSYSGGLHNDWASTPRETRHL